MQMGTPGVQGGGARSPWGKEPHSGPRSRGVQGPPAPREQLEEAGEERTLGSWPGRPEDLSPGVAGSRGEGRTGGSLPHGMRGQGFRTSGVQDTRSGERQTGSPPTPDFFLAREEASPARAGELGRPPPLWPLRPGPVPPAGAAVRARVSDVSHSAVRTGGANSRPARPESRRPARALGRCQAARRRR